MIESQFSIDQYFEFILSMGFATGIAFQVPVLQAMPKRFSTTQKPLRKLVSDQKHGRFPYNMASESRF